MVTFELDKNAVLTDHEKQQLSEAAKRPIVYDEDSPPLTSEMEKAFIAAERHPLFRGAIGFLMDNMPSSVEAFSKRSSLVGELFDSKGIIDRLRKDHKLIRCFVQLRRKTMLPIT